VDNTGKLVLVAGFLGGCGGALYIAAESCAGKIGGVIFIDNDAGGYRQITLVGSNSGVQDRVYVSRFSHD